MKLDCRELRYEVCIPLGSCVPKPVVRHSVMMTLHEKRGILKVRVVLVVLLWQYAQFDYLQFLTSCGLLYF